MILINNKIKQFFKGNWGKPTKMEQGLKLRSVDLEPTHIPGKKKKRKCKNPKIFEWDCCPFCYQELPLDEDLKIKKEGIHSWRSIFDRRVKICPNCKAQEIAECPCCKRQTWCKDGWHKHQGSIGCGFNGEKLIRQRKN